MLRKFKILFPVLLTGLLLFSIFNIDYVRADPYTGEEPICEDGYCVVAFLESGEWTPPDNMLGDEVDVLVVAGGGAGAVYNNNSAPAGGGGAGGLVFYPNYNVSSLSKPISITIGLGGPGCTATSGGMCTPGSNGQDTVFASITAKGGGVGGSSNEPEEPTTGGSGGGTWAWITLNHTGASGIQPSQSGDSGSPYGFGNSGGTGDNNGDPATSGGGGGAGGAGAKPTGGVGLYQVTINSETYNFIELFGDTYGHKVGDEIYFAGGGGGSSRYASAGGGGSGGGSAGTKAENSSSGMPNTGGGSGGVWGDKSSSYTSGDGGSGIVIIRYQITPFPNFTFPENDMTITNTLDVNFTWIDPTELGLFHLQVSKVENFSVLDLNASDIENLFYVETLDNLETYWARIRGYDANESEWTEWDTITFDIDYFVGLPTIIAPENMHTYEEPDTYKIGGGFFVDFEWTPLAGHEYDLQLTLAEDDFAFTEYDESGLTEGTFEFRVFQGEEYKARVRATWLEGNVTGEWSTIEFSVDFKPNLLAPIGTIIEEPKPDLIWTSYDYNLFYDIQVSKMENFSVLDLNLTEEQIEGEWDNTEVKCYYELDLEQEETYYARVKLSLSEEWSDTIEFTLSYFPIDIPNFQVPLFGQTYNRLNLMAEWDYIPGSQAYELLICDDVENLESQEGCILQVLGLEYASHYLSSGTYYYDIRTKFGATDFSDWRSEWKTLLEVEINTRPSFVGHFKEDYAYETFTESGTFTIPANVSSVEVLVVGGGGGAGTAFYDIHDAAGGGGAGGFVLQEYEFSEGELYAGEISVIVGQGGAGGIKDIYGASHDGTDGGNSSFGDLVAIGGGGGGGASSGYQDGKDGGSGGGAGFEGQPVTSIYGIGTIGQGKDGANARYTGDWWHPYLWGGGGGGASSAGVNHDGGEGLSYLGVLYSRGGNGGRPNNRGPDLHPYHWPTPPENSGWGGTAYWRDYTFGPTDFLGGAGADGIVIVKYYYLSEIPTYVAHEPVLSWSSIGGATGYHLEIFLLDGELTATQMFEGIDDGSISPDYSETVYINSHSTDFLPNGTYLARVRAFDDYAQGEWSAYNYDSLYMFNIEVSEIPFIYTPNSTNYYTGDTVFYQFYAIEEEEWFDIYELNTDGTRGALIASRLVEPDSEDYGDFSWTIPSNIRGPFSVVLRSTGATLFKHYVEPYPSHLYLWTEGYHRYRIWYGAGDGDALSVSIGEVTYSGRPNMLHDPFNHQNVLYQRGDYVKLYYQIMDPDENEFEIIIRNMATGLTVATISSKDLWGWNYELGYAHRNFIVMSTDGTVPDIVYQHYAEQYAFEGTNWNYLSLEPGAYDYVIRDVNYSNTGIQSIGESVLLIGNNRNREWTITPSQTQLQEGQQQQWTIATPTEGIWNAYKEMQFIDYSSGVAVYRLTGAYDDFARYPPSYSNTFTLSYNTEWDQMTAPTARLIVRPMNRNFAPQSIWYTFVIDENYILQSEETSGDITAPIDNFLAQFGLNTTLFKFLVGLGALIAGIVAMGVYGLPTLVIGLVSLLSYVLLVFLGWIPMWTMIILAMAFVAVLYKMFFNGTGGNGGED